MEIFVGQERRFEKRCQLVYPPKTSVVAGVLVLRARVAKANKQFNHVPIILLANGWHKKARLKRALEKAGAKNYFLPLPLAGAAAAGATSGAASSTTVTTLTTTGLFLP